MSSNLFRCKSNPIRCEPAAEQNFHISWPVYSLLIMVGLNSTLQIVKLYYVLQHSFKVPILCHLFGYLSLCVCNWKILVMKQNNEKEFHFFTQLIIVTVELLFWLNCCVIILRSPVNLWKDILLITWDVYWQCMIIKNMWFKNLFKRM